MVLHATFSFLVRLPLHRGRLLVVAVQPNLAAPIVANPSIWSAAWLAHACPCDTYTAAICTNFWRKAVRGRVTRLKSTQHETLLKESHAAVHLYLQYLQGWFFRYSHTVQSRCSPVSREISTRYSLHHTPSLPESLRLKSTLPYQKSFWVDMLGTFMHKGLSFSHSCRRMYSHDKLSACAT
jgi:hypothetical protein